MNNIIHLHFNSFNFKPLFFFTLLCLLISGCVFSQTNIAPELTATGDQIYCTGSDSPIALSFTINDPDDVATEAIYVQISSGYENGEDVLSLSGTHPGITSSWNAATAKLTIEGNTGQDVPYTDLIVAVEDVVYTNTATNPTPGTRTFSITIGQANYLESTGHYYLYIPSVGINWLAAKNAAEASDYYGLQGYLATILSEDEAQLIGEQAQGTGWIGGTDEETEGIWKWTTGPEAGTVFWNGGVTGSTPNFAFWNTGEPNNQDNEDYAHITAPGVGIQGSWNDLQLNGGVNEYAPQGYIVEYGGMPGDPTLNISATTTIEVVTITGNTSLTLCGSGTATLEATSSNGMVYWYTDATGGTPIATGNTYTTPTLTTTTIYYAEAENNNGCTTAERLAITVTVENIPTLILEENINACFGSSITIEATPSAGIVNWYTELTGGVPVATGNEFVIDNITEDMIYYAEVESNACISETREAIIITVIPLPVANPDETIVFCENTTRPLDAEINDTNVTYLWSTGATTPIITITEPGTYTATITNEYGCETTQVFETEMLNAPEIIDVNISNTDEAIIIMASNTQEYEYSVDGGDYQLSPIFRGLRDGMHIAQARSLNGCGTDAQNFRVLLVQKFFTPNNDMINDVFTIAGFDYYPEATVIVFDRFGKLITQLDKRNRNWDGTFNGNELPATDYWYVIKLNKTSPEIKGHVSLIR